LTLSKGVRKMRWLLILLVLSAGCTAGTKSTVSVLFEKDLWMDSDRYIKPDARAKVEYHLELADPWPFTSRNRHE
jgi:hypothetical protein